MNACVAQAVDKDGVFDAAHTMTDAGWVEVLDRFPDTLRAACFAGVSGAMETVLDRIAEGRNVGIDGEACFVTGDVKGRDASASKLLDEMRGMQALFGAEVAQRAEDETGLDAGGADALLRRAIDGGDDGLRREPLIRVKERSETQFGIEDVVGGELARKYLR